jgi:hypothetical protein
MHCLDIREDDGGFHLSVGNPIGIVLGEGASIAIFRELWERPGGRLRHHRALVDVGSRHGKRSMRRARGEEAQAHDEQRDFEETTIHVFSLRRALWRETTPRYFGSVKNVMSVNSSTSLRRHSTNISIFWTAYRRFLTQYRHVKADFPGSLRVASRKPPVSQIRCFYTFLTSEREFDLSDYGSQCDPNRIIFRFLGSSLRIVNYLQD